MNANDRTIAPPSPAATDGSVQEIAAAYFDREAIREAPRKLYRYERAGNRWYYTMADTDEETGAPRARLFPSVTTIIKGSTPMPPFLLKWIAEHGQRRAEQLRDERAAYGTLMHILFAELAIAGRFDVETLVVRVENFLESKRLTLDASAWPEELARDLVGFSDFMREHEAKPLGIEVPLVDADLGYAGCIDLVIRGTFELSQGRGRKKQLWRGVTQVDWKSNRLNFYEDGAIQCHAYGALWNAVFPELPVERVFLYGAKDWDESSRERYRLQDVTDHKLSGLFPNLLEQFRFRHQGHANRTTVSGVIRLDSDSSACVSTETVESWLSRKHAA